MIALIRAAHLQPALAVTAITTTLAVSVGRVAGGAITLALAVAAGQLSVGWSNDYIDRDRDRAAGRLDKPIVAGEVGAGVVAAAGIAAFVVCVPLSLLAGWRSGVLHLAAVGAAWSYNARLKATVASPLPYVFAFGSLPAVVTLGLARHPWPPWWAMTGGALLGAGAHFVNTIADADADLLVGVRGLPQRLGPTVALWVGALLLASATVVLAIAPPGPAGRPVVVLAVTAGVLVAAVLVAARRGRPRDAWSLTIATAVIAVVVFLANGDALA